MKLEILKEQADAILKQSFWGMAGVSLKEDTAAVEQTETEEQAEQPEEALTEEAHVCPLCESHLEEPISDEKIQEHMELVASILTEMETTDEELEEIQEVDGTEDEQEPA